MKSGKDEEIVPREPEKDIIDKALQYGKYQSLLIWIFGTSIGRIHRFQWLWQFFDFLKFSAFIGAIDYIQLVFMLNDRQDWTCLEPEREMCDETLDGMRQIRQTWHNNCGGIQVLRAFAVGERSSSTRVIQTSFTHLLWNINGSVSRSVVRQKSLPC